MVLKIMLSIWSVLILVWRTSSADIIYDVKFPTTEFRIVDPSTIEFTNPYRQNAKIKFSFEGGNFTRMEHKHASDWTLNMFGNTKNTVQVYNHSVPQSKTAKYTFNWWHSGQILSAEPEICFDLAFNNASWFSTFLEQDQPWPLNSGKPIAKPIPLITGSYGTNQFGPVVDNLVYNTDGFAIIFVQYRPNYFRRTADHRICFSVMSDHPPEKTDRTHFISLDFDLIVAQNIVQVHDECVNRHKYVQKTYRDEIPDERMFKLPILNLDVHLLNQTQVLEHAKDIAKHGLTKAQLVLENWEAQLGDLKFDKVRFLHPKEMIAQLHKLGFVVKLQVHSFVSEKSELFKVHKNHLLTETSNSHKPLLFNWTTHGLGGLIQFHSLTKEVEWFTDILEALRKEAGVDSFRFSGGELGQFGLSDKLLHRTRDPIHYPNVFTRNHVFAAELLGKMIDVDAGYRTQLWPIFVRMPDVKPDWTGLKSIITTALTMSIAGYSYITPGVLKTSPDGTKPSSELYIRWVQACTFFPSMQLSPLPWTYTDNVVNITRKYMDLHSAHSTAIRDMAKQSSGHGTPLLRPLWYLSPNDAHTHAVWDQFALGNDLVVAPVFEPSQLKRTVYLPSGNWIDQHGQSYAGPNHFQIVTPLEELAYFQRKL